MTESRITSRPSPKRPEHLKGSGQGLDNPRVQAALSGREYTDEEIEALNAEHSKKLAEDAS